MFSDETVYIRIVVASIVMAIFVGFVFSAVGASALTAIVMGAFVGACVAAAEAPLVRMYRRG